MLIFMDESGDTGFKFDLGSSRYFVNMLVLVPDAQIAESLRERIEEVRRNHRWSKEFHFNETPDDIRRAFLQAMGSHRSLVFRAIVVPKTDIFSGFLRENNDSFYNYVTRQVLEYDGGTIQQAKLFIDKRGPRAWRNALAVYLRRQLNSRQQYKILDIKQKDWKENALMQIADRYSGALYRKITKNDTRFYDKIKKQKQDVWWFQ
ncbi:MAG: hypothetical protein C7B45_03805 [Sulfobacillus acidophilus]|uniref:DUF3800 domain-containing protein n=1 Tax=Sulfobacillus acidophilus TaxID=53633 RepID=A0A2T2WLW4_9FIRM|nr:MAG: hypothetical protein C7B45_03805 [Sulfobacillus acidophilus]